MRKFGAVLASAALAVGVIFFGAYIGTTSDMRRAKAQTVPARPNIVFILTDDMRKDDLKYMQETRSLLEGRGMSFSNAFVSNALCCPSRATIMGGQYSHNNGVWFNGSTTGGCRQDYQQNGGEEDNVATRLDDAGYRTGLFGKYLNTSTAMPPGWDRWFATKEGYFDYYVNDQGSKRHFGAQASDYQTDVLSGKANTFIRNSASLGNPFFAYIAPKAPHLPAVPAPRDLHTFDGEKAPRLPSFNEAEVSDKPPWVRQLPTLRDARVAEIDNRHEDRVESLQAVDAMVQGVVRTLREAREMRNTYIFFTSDNGYHHGEHRISMGKWRPYEEDIRMPLLVRGPGVEPGSSTSRLVLNTDYMPTFTDLACPSSNPCDTRNWSYVPDGRSLRPVLEGKATTWRSAILAESQHVTAPSSYGIRTRSEKYVEYADTAKWQDYPDTRELYELHVDPYELANSYDSTAPPSGLASRLNELRTCAAGTCRMAESGR